ncbi:MAG: PIN domain-containing protein [Candidatus Acididesulfobacter diazotrophicus]|uniref:PIN domain-containing protein n=1 Tax=Candidatus Acididesulfobacter diazotrophicus TaxID=2597226 RepID=A0A519BM52_9DELT|nr:MAG: PIN domain-containing protein [Candidatus Acididesulfobacter diazotrophicus]
MSNKSLKLTLYLDLCVYNRPFDYQGQERIALETSAFIYILERIENGFYNLVISDALNYENNKNQEEDRKDRIFSYFGLASELIEIDNSDIKRAKILKDLGFTDIDALHIALAEKGNINYFVTCDDGILKLYNKNKNAIKVNIVSVIELVNKEK